MNTPLEPSHSSMPQPLPSPQQQQQLSASTTARVAALRVEFPGWDGVVPTEEVEHWSANDLRMFAGSGGYLTPPPLSKPRPASMASAAAPTDETHELAKQPIRNDPRPVPPPPQPMKGDTTGSSHKEVTPGSVSGASNVEKSANTKLDATAGAPSSVASHPNACASQGTASTSGAGRWFLDVNAWQPSAAEWALALAQLNDSERVAVRAPFSPL